MPLLGPSTVRDSAGLVVNSMISPINQPSDATIKYAANALYVIDTRADLLGAGQLLEEAALDPYDFMKDAYLQKRHADVHDGNPPLEQFD